jgi:hypothetical protein
VQERRGYMRVKGGANMIVRIAGTADLRRAEERAEMLWKELEAERSKGFRQRLFGG